MTPVSGIAPSLPRTPQRSVTRWIRPLRSSGGSTSRNGLRRAFRQGHSSWPATLGRYRRMAPGACRRPVPGGRAGRPT